MNESPTEITRQELLDLRKQYMEEVNKQLTFCFRYLNFYIGLFSAILAATLAGLFATKSQPLLGLVLLIGPALIGLLAFVGYKTVRVFYRRFVEAWITCVNLEVMLGLKPTPKYQAGIHPPAFPSAQGRGFITEFERPEIRDLLEQAQKEAWTAETLLKKVLEVGDTLLYAKITFGGYVLAGLVAAVVVIVTAW